MKNLTANLMLIDRMIIFTDYYLEDTIDFNLFVTGLENDVQFIDQLIELSFTSFLKITGVKEKKNTYKLLLSTITRFKRSMNRIINFVNTEYKSDYNGSYLFEKIEQEAGEKLHFLKNYNYEIKHDKTEKNYINENEYAILLQTLDEV